MKDLRVSDLPRSPDWAQTVPNPALAMAPRCPAPLAHFPLLWARARFPQFRAQDMRQWSLPPRVRSRPGWASEPGCPNTATLGKFSITGNAQA